MSRILKWLAAGVGALVVLVVAGILAVTLLIDPNTFRPEIEKLAKKQGLALTLGGDLAWQFFPDLGIAVEKVAVAPVLEPQAPIASINKAALSVQLMPLFSGKVAVNGIVLDGLDAKLVVDAEGKGNWEKLTAGREAAASDQPTDAPDGKFSLAVHRLSVSNSQVSYTNAQSQQAMTLRNFMLEGTDIALNGQPFALNTSGEFTLEDAEKNTRAGRFEVVAGIAVNEAMTTVAISDGKVTAEVAGKEVKQSVSGKLTLAAKLPADKQPLALDVLELADAEVAQENTATGQKLSAAGLRLAASGITLEPLAVASLDLSSTQVASVNAASQQVLTVQGLALKAQAIALDEKLFPLSIKGTLKAEQPDLPTISTAFDFSGNVSVDEAINRIVFDQARLAALLDGEAGQNLDARWNMKLVLEPFAYNGDVKVMPVNGRKAMAVIGQTLPETKSPTAFSKVGFSGYVEGSDNAVKASDMSLVLDESTFTGSVAMTDIANSALVVKLKGDRLNADDYLAPEPAPAAGGAVAASAETGDEPLIPMDTLKGLNMDVDLVIGSLVFNSLPFSDLAAVVKAHGGKVNISRFAGKLYDSPMQLVANVDASGEQAVIDFDASSKQLPVGRLLKDLGIEERFSGSSDVEAKGRTAGISKNQLLKALDANVDLSGRQMQLADVNVEKAVCEFISQAQGQPMSAVAWDNFTKLRDMTTRVKIKNGEAKVQNLEAGVEEIALKTNGIFDFIKGDFDFHLTTRLVQAIVDGASCKVTDQKLLNRDIPIRCKGNLDTIGLKTCLPDLSLAEDMAKALLKEETDAAKARVQAETDAAKAKAQAEVDAAKAKAKADADKAIKKKLGEEGGKAAKDLLKGLIKE